MKKFLLILFTVIFSFFVVRAVFSAKDAKGKYKKMEILEQEVKLLESTNLELKKQIDYQKTLEYKNEVKKKLSNENLELRNKYKNNKTKDAEISKTNLEKWLAVFRLNF